MRRGGSVGKIDAAVGQTDVIEQHFNAAVRNDFANFSFNVGKDGFRLLNARAGGGQ